MLQLIESEASNFKLYNDPGLILKESSWRWPERNLSGNALDFLVLILGVSFHKATRQITTYSPSNRPLPSLPFDGIAVIRLQNKMAVRAAPNNPMRPHPANGSHVVCLLHAQLSHALGLNQV